jgi:phosphoribosyl 1,2-cyclic phosphodiesterase/ActR/RegA family two-component response regulator
MEGGSAKTGRRAPSHGRCRPHDGGRAGAHGVNNPLPFRLKNRKKILLVDHDPALLAIRKLRLLADGYEVRAVGDSSRVMEAMEAFRPDLVVLELLMPDAPGQGLLEQIRKDPRFESTRVIVNSVMTLECDYQFCLESQADAYLAKPMGHNVLSETVRKLLDSNLTVRFWGTRGDIARPGRDTLKYGGNTPCVAVESGKNDLLVLDAGSGIVGLGRALAGTKQDSRFHVLLSHPHWDHIQGLPFFQPLRRQGNEIVVHGAGNDTFNLRNVIDTHMRTMLPVTTWECASRVVVNDLGTGSRDIGRMRVSTMYLDPAALTLGYRIEDRAGRSIAYLTDYEIRPRGDPHRERLVDFINGVDVLIHDAVYFDDERPSRAGWGHPPLTEVLELAADAGVGSLYLFHHDPAQNDKAIDRKEAAGSRYFARKGLDIMCEAAKEGSIVLVGGASR